VINMSVWSGHVHASAIRVKAKLERQPYSAAIIHQLDHADVPMTGLAAQAKAASAKGSLAQFRVNPITQLIRPADALGGQAGYYTALAKTIADG
jgi:hypothetical protein